MELKRKLEKEFFFETILFVVAVISISQFYPDNILLTIILASMWLIALSYWHTRRDIYFFVTGALTGTILGIISANSGAWMYSNPTALGIPLWLPLAWGFAAMIIKRIVYTFSPPKRF